MSAQFSGSASSLEGAAFAGFRGGASTIVRSGAVPGDRRSEGRRRPGGAEPSGAEYIVVAAAGGSLRGKPPQARGTDAAEQPSPRPGPEITAASRSGNPDYGRRSGRRVA